MLLYLGKKITDFAASKILGIDVMPVFALIKRNFY